MALEVAGGAFHSALFQTLLEKMASSEVINFCSKKKVNRGLLQKLKILLLSANAVLDDPEEKQLRNQFVRKCLHMLKEATYDAEDLMAEICEENLQSEIEGAFERRRYMNLVVQRARHPDLRDYIHSAVFGLLPFIEKGLVERVAVIFFNTDNIPVERFMFKLAVNQASSSKVEDADLEFSLRSFLMKLSVSEPLTKVLSHDCRWEITGYFRSFPEASSSKTSELWIPTDTKQWQQPPLITPIKSMSSEPLCVQLYLEHPSLNEPKP